MATISKLFEQESSITDLIDKVASEWRVEFERFVTTGEAQEAFFNYLNQDTAAQEAVEQAFTRQAKRFEHLAEDLKQQQPEVSESATSIAQSSTSRRLAAKNSGRKVVDTTTAALAALDSCRGAQSFRGGCEVARTQSKTS